MLFAVNSSNFFKAIPDTLYTMPSCDNLKIESRTITLAAKTGDEIGTGLERPTPLEVDIVSVTFQPEQLYVVDINAKRKYLEDKGITGDAAQRQLSGIFANPLGGRADEVLAMPDFDSACVVSGGLLFDKKIVDGVETSVTEPFLFFKPDQANGRVIAPPKYDYGSGGFLAIPVQGVTKLIRLRDFKWDEAAAQICERDDCESLTDYRLIVQSKPVLVSYDHQNKKALNDGGLKLTDITPRTALVANVDGSLSIVCTDDAITLDAFADTLLGMGGVMYALNLDGGPSTQLVVRQKSGTVKLAGYDNNELPGRMPSLLIVTAPQQ